LRWKFHGKNHGNYGKYGKKPEKQWKKLWKTPWFEMETPWVPRK
jgi:hypothetical protein